MLEQPVFFRQYINKLKWVPGVISKKLGRKMYIVQKDNANYRRQQNQLRTQKASQDMHESAVDGNLLLKNHPKNSITENNHVPSNNSIIWESPTAASPVDLTSLSASNNQQVNPSSQMRFSTTSTPRRSDRLRFKKVFLLFLNKVRGKL